MRFALTVLAAALIASTASALAAGTLYPYTFRIPVTSTRVPATATETVNCKAYSGQYHTGLSQAFALNATGQTQVEKTLTFPFKVKYYDCTLMLKLGNKSYTDPSKLPTGWSAVMDVSGNITQGNQ